MGSIPTTAAILILCTGCAGAYITPDKMAVGAVGHSYLKACKQPVKVDAVTELIAPKGNASVQPEMRKWAYLAGDTQGNEVATTQPLVGEQYCVEIGNNTPPSGFFESFMNLIETVAPYVAAYFGIGKL